MVFSDLKLHKVILELRYEHGFLYLDRCGQTYLKILKKYPDWKFVSASPQTALLKIDNKDLEMNFSYHNIVITQESVENLNQFKTKSNEIIPIITSELEVKKFQRIGNRYLFIFPIDNIEYGEKLITKTKLLNIPSNKLSLFGKDIKSSTIVVVIENNSLNYRIELKTVERNDKSIPQNFKILNEIFNPKYALLLDIDIFTTIDIKVEDFKSSEFIQKNYKTLENNLAKFLKGE